MVGLCGTLERLCTGIPGFKIDRDAYVLANLSYATMPMVEDLERSVEYLATNDLIAALAGDEEAREAIRERTGDVDPSLPDSTPPSDEFLILDADASQNWAINTAPQGESGSALGTITVNCRLDSRSGRVGPFDLDQMHGIAAVKEGRIGVRSLQSLA